MTDLAAAVGRPQLARLDASIAVRRALAARYIAALQGHPFLVAPQERSDARSNWQSFPVTVRAGAGTATQNELVRWFDDQGIACRRGLTNAHQEPAYAGRNNWSGGPLPESEYLRDNTVFLPLFHGMSAAESDAVLEAIDALRSARP